MPRALVTGFEAFGGDTVNPSALVARALDGRVVAGREIVATVLPCVFGKALVALEGALERASPELVVCVGQAGGRSGITVERVAINVDDARIPDNEGAQPIDRPVVADGPAAYWSTLPIKAIAHALALASVPVDISQSAGTFVCNHVFYGLMHALRARPDVRAGFVHIPWLPEQAQQAGPRAPSMRVEDMTRGLEIVLETALTTSGDLVRAGGATH